MAGKSGPASAWGPIVDGYDFTNAKITGLTIKVISEMAETTGLGDGWKERTPIGVEDVELSQEGGLWDTTAVTGSHAALSASVPTTPQAAVRVLCAGFAGATIGEPFFGIQGAYTHEYEVVSELGDLHRANVTYSVSGQIDDGVVLQPLATKTANWDTESTPVDNSASSANGGVGYLQVTAGSGFTNFVGSIEDSPDDIAYTQLLAFTDNVVDPFAERVTVAGTVNRYLDFKGVVTGSGTITVFCGFSRNE